MENRTPFFDAVFFDMDGLMVDSEPEWFQSEIEVTRPFGYIWLESDQIACLGGPLSRVGEYMFEKCGEQKLRNSSPNLSLILKLPRCAEILQQCQEQ